MASHTQHHLGNGTSIPFWKPPWLNYGILSSVFPRLFRLAHFPDIKVADVWVEDAAAWHLRIHCNLTESKIVEDGFITAFTICLFREVADSWIWTTGPSSSLSVLSLMDGLARNDIRPASDVYSAIWLDCYP